MKKNKILIIIPSRFASTRLPEKPLVKIAGKEMVVTSQHLSVPLLQFSEVIITAMFVIR